MSTTTTATGVAAPTGTWAFDPVHSTVGFTVLYMGVAPFKGEFRDFSATLDEQGLRGTAVAASIDVDNETLAEHLAGPDFFEADKHPELEFRTQSIETGADGRVTVDGELVIKGNLAPVTLTGTQSGPVADPWGNSKLGLTLAGRVDRNAVGLSWNAPLPDGGAMLADEVELAATLVFVQQAEA